MPPSHWSDRWPWPTLLLAGSAFTAGMVDGSHQPDRYSPWLLVLIVPCILASWTGIVAAHRRDRQRLLDAAAEAESRAYDNGMIAGRYQALHPELYSSTNDATVRGYAPKHLAGRGHVRLVDDPTALGHIIADDIDAELRRVRNEGEEG